MFGKNILTYIILFSIVSLIVIYVLFQLKKTPQDRKKSLQTGYGSYSDEYSLGCKTKSGKCNEQAMEKTIQYCQPHPTTGRGCLDNNGNQTYNSVINTRKCKLQCISSKFTVQDGVKLSDPHLGQGNNLLRSSLVSRGCNKVTDRRYGTDYTDYFFGSFDSSDGKYYVKGCIPGDNNYEFLTYYTQELVCTPHDEKGSNSCKIICGENDNVLNLTGYTDQKTSSKLLNYFPKEFNEEGDVRYVCYDIHNTDQIEILNYSANIPESFVYPNKCYKHTNVKNINHSLLWPNTGTSVNVFYLNFINTITNSNYIQLTGEYAQNFQKVIDKNTGIISSDYNINKNQNSYVKLRLGTKLALLNSFFNYTNTGITTFTNVGYYENTTPSSIENYIMYIAFQLTDKIYSDYKQNGITAPLLSPLLDWSAYTSISFINASGTVLSPASNPLELTGIVTGLQQDGDRFYWVEEQSGKGILYLPLNYSNLFKNWNVNNPSEINFLDYGSGYTVVFLPNLSTVYEWWLTTSNASNIFYLVIKEPDSNGNIIKRNVVKEGTISQDSGKPNYILFENLTINSNSSIESFYYLTTEDLYDALKSDSGYSIKSNKTTLPSGITMNIFQSFMTNNIYCKKFYDSPAAYQYMGARDQSYIETVDQNTAFVVFATPYTNHKSYYYPMYLNNSGERSNYIQVGFIEFPQVIFYAKEDPAELNFNSYFRPQYYENQPLVYFNEMIKVSRQSYDNSYIEINPGTSLYFLSNLKTINTGFNYAPSTLYNLYSDQFDSKYNLSSNIYNTPGTSTSHAVITSRDGVFESTEYTRTLEVITGRSPLLISSSIVGIPADINQKKVYDYYQIIKNQNFASFTVDPEGTFPDIELIVEPEKHLSLLANYEVFKGPYTLNGDGSKNFLCFTNTGRALSKGTIKKIYPSETSTVFVNLNCPSGNVKFQVKSGGMTCANKGIESNGLLQKCFQERNNQNNNFIGTSSCIVSENLEEYTTLNNNFEQGLQLEKIYNGPAFFKPPSKSIGTFPAYFTKILEQGKIYRPYEEFYVEKMRENLFISLADGNNNFVDNVSFWKMIYPFEQNTFSNPLEIFFENFTPNVVPNKLNISSSIGKFGDITYKGNVSLSTDINISFNTKNQGINCQNFLNQGVGFYWGNNRRNLLARFPLQSLAARGKYIPGDLTSYIGSLRAVNNRDIYDSYAFNNTSSDLVGQGQTPRWTSLKYINGIPAMPSGDNFLFPESPVFATFSVIKTETEKYKFSSKLYDSNLTSPWNQKLEEGDIFSPDFVYFSTFVYMFILCSGEVGSTGNFGVGEFGTLTYTPMSNYMLGASSTSKIFNEGVKVDIDTLSSFSYNTGNTQYSPSVNDYLLFIPYKVGVDLTDSNWANLTQTYKVFALDPSFPVVYTTYFIKKIISVSGDTITLSSQNFSQPSQSWINGGYYIFNLGRDNIPNNLINRNFEINSATGVTQTSIGSSQMPSGIASTITNSPKSDNNFYRPLTDYTYTFDKNYIEFHFEIESISQNDMLTLYEQYTPTSFKPTSGVTVYAYDKKEKDNDYKGLQCRSSSYPTGPECYGLNNPTTGDSCMPGDAGSSAACYSYLQDPGHTSLYCPGPKFWRCHLGSGGVETNLVTIKEFFNGTNQLTPALSAKYIKKNVNIPYSYIGPGKYACLNTSSRQGVLETQVMSQSTRIMKYIDDDNSTYYYINEFRERDAEFKPQFKRTFSVGDTFDYYHSALNINTALSGNKNFVKVLSLQVVDVDVTLTVKYRSMTPDSSGNFTYPGYGCVFDYKCRLLEQFVDSSSPDPFRTFTNDYEPGTSANVGVWKSFFLYYNSASYSLIQPLSNTPNPDTPNPSNGHPPPQKYIQWDWQLPYTINVTNSTILDTNVMSMGSGILYETTLPYLSERCFLMGSFADTDTFPSPGGILFGSTLVLPQAGWLQTSGLGTLVPPPSYFFPLGETDVFHDSYKFKDINSKNFQEPNYNLNGPNAESIVYMTYSYPSYPNWINLMTAKPPESSSPPRANTSFNQYWTYASTTYSGDAIRSGNLDMMVLTGTTLVSDTTFDKVFVNVKVTGKPCGIPYFPSSPVGGVSVPNYNSFGKIESFHGNFSGYPENAVFISDKGFEIKILSSPPNSYSFQSVILQNRNITTYDRDLVYTKGDIVSFVNLNLRQYFRNTSPYSVPYLKIPDVTSNLIPFTISSGADNSTWYYPVFKKYEEGLLSLNVGNNTVYYLKNTLVKNSTNNSNYINYNSTSSTILKALTDFKTVARTVYPENNFQNYIPTSYYSQGELVLFDTLLGPELYESLKSNNIGNPYTDSSYWKRKILTNNLSSNTNISFYSKNIPDNNFTDYINDLRSLNNQNLPALIKRTDKSDEFCPKPCTFVNNTLENNFINIANYEKIKYLFESPVLLKNNTTELMVSLGNGPVMPGKTNYNTGFLQSSNTRSAFISQYLYYLDLKDQENKYAREKCTGNLFITKSEGTSIDTNIKKFQFSNSIVFNFNPCDIDSQDFISYNVNAFDPASNSLLVTSQGYPSSDTLNQFPPAGTSVSVIGLTDEGNFTELNGHFNFTRITKNYSSTLSSTVLTNISSSNETVQLKNVKFGEGISFPSVSGVCYGDIWFNSNEGSSSNPDIFGFAIPDSSGQVSQDSYISLSYGTSFGTSFGLITSTGVNNFTNTTKNQVKDFTIENYGTGATSGTYSSSAGSLVPSFEIYVLFDPSGIILQNFQAIFYTDTDISSVGNITKIYLPTYDITKNIKTKCIGSFGQDYFGKLTYSLDTSSSILNLQNQQLSPLIFSQLTNDLLLADNQKISQKVFQGTSTKTVDNCFETFIVNFENDGSFSLKPNLFRRPITATSNYLIYNPKSSINPLNSLACINSDSNTTFISESLTNISGVSMNLDFNELLNYSLNYNTQTNPVQIPGKTIIQTQMEEVRQNISSTYIDENNFCSIFFTGQNGVNQSSLISDTLTIKYQSKETIGYPAYTLNSSHPSGPRLYGNFQGPTKLDLYSKTTVFLGGDLIYRINQDDKSNIYPIVFGKTPFTTDFKTSDIDMGLPGDQKFRIKYYIRTKEVSYEKYKLEFDISDRRSIEITYIASFDTNDYSGASIFFGIPEPPYYQAGGKIKFEYH